MMIIAPQTHPPVYINVRLLFFSCNQRERQEEIEMKQTMTISINSSNPIISHILFFITSTRFSSLKTRYCDEIKGRRRLRSGLPPRYRKHTAKNILYTGDDVKNPRYKCKNKTIPLLYSVIFQSFILHHLLHTTSNQQILDILDILDISGSMRARGLLL